MKRTLNYFLLLMMLVLGTVYMSAQQPANFRGQHKVKKKETVFGISRNYGLTIEELINANPEMKEPGYELKKGMILNIPYPKSVQEAQEAERAAKARKAAEEAAVKADDVRNREIRLGVMLPLHNINGDGRRMMEYYRGVLMACDSLKKQGLSIDVHAWNTATNGCFVGFCFQA